MAPQTRGMSFPKVVIERDSDTEESSSEDEDDELQNDAVEESDEEQLVADDDDNNKDEEASTSTKTKRQPITISLKKVCKVCKKPGHEAGFKGATYIDCPMKPCFLCKMPGHTTMTCPHRVATEYGVAPAPHKRTHSSVEYVFERQLRCRVSAMKPKFVIPNKVNCACIGVDFEHIEYYAIVKIIAFHVVKKGQLGVWDYEKVHERTVYGNIHGCILNNMRFSPANDGTVYGASSDGTVSSTDLETGISLSLLNLNPNGWQGPSSWRMLYGLDMNCDKGVLVAADNFGLLYTVDMRSNNVTGNPTLIHKKGSKVTGLHCHPLQPDLLLSCGNDHFARIWDMRRLEAGSSLYALPHTRVVNSAYFSPQTGSKILTTSQDNRLRDVSESLVVVGRYISENYNGVALHPIDFIDVSTGQLVAEVIDPNITTITPVNKLHPRDDVLASGSSRSIFIWRPQEKMELEQRKDDESRIVLCGKDEKKRKGKFEDDDDSGDDFDKKNLKTKKPYFKSKGHASKRKC
ncbi:protein damaged DNA-binding 2 [Phtheirospermum japonicum]|uniref:Protein damaged DNA-binding 2 n=1 Tax=Phtheirospermum japonicum TaxID=374723 RepID=A0A830B0N8_9LAMI|nr:protein damaged DNA-binding 2 [Phtheirospermum japonicum]